MELNRAKLIKALSSIDKPGVSKLRTWDTSYKNKTVTYWNSILWEKILEHENIFGSAIDRYEFYNFCSYYCSNEESRKIFNMINQKSRSILFDEFESFLEKIDKKDYDNIMDSLEEIYIPDPEPEFEFNIAIEPEIESESLPESESELEHESESLVETDSEHQSDPLSIPVVEPITENVSEVASEPITESVSEVASELITETVSEVESKPLTENVSKVAPELITESVSEVAPEPITETEVQPLVLSKPLSVQKEKLQTESRVESLLEPLLESPPQPQPESKPQPESNPFYVEIFNKIKSFFFRY